MRHSTFLGRDIASVHALAQKAFGDDTLIVATRATTDAKGRAAIEVDAVPQEDLLELTQLIRAPRPLRPRGVRPVTIALVGPTGAGKTTTIAKLATHPEVFSGAKVGLLSLDTHRAMGFEQLNAYAEAAGLSCAVAWDRVEVARALRRFSGCDFILVDTAGRGPTTPALRERTRGLLAALQPDEVHLVVPATLRLDLAARVRAEHAALRPTHQLMTKLDEVPADLQLGALASGLGLPARWVTDGQDVPAHLKAAAGAILSPFGISPRAMEAA